MAASPVIFGLLEIATHLCDGPEEAAQALVVRAHGTSIFLFVALVSLQMVALFTGMDQCQVFSIGLQACKVPSLGNESMR